MCGTIGMFVGCQVLTACPRQLLLETADPEEPPAGLCPADDLDEADDGVDYRSPFRSWHERAAVRVMPRRFIDADTGSRHYFSPELVPIALHERIRELPEPVYRGLLIQHLYRYLDFTAKLESLVVNRVVLGIAHGTVGVRVPADMRFDAYKIYCDEAYHTLFSVDLARQVEASSGVAPRLPARPYFLWRLAQLQRDLPPERRPLMELLFVVISETLISATLAEVPDSADVVSAVRATVSDHAADEGRHHAYFAAFLKLLWAGLSPAERDRAGVWVPRLADAFLRPDFTAIHTELRGYGLPPDDVEAVISEVFPEETLHRQRSLVTRQTLRYFGDLDAFRSPESQEQLAAYGFATSAAQPVHRKQQTATEENHA